MEHKVTHNVDSHHTNPAYQCLLVNLLKLPEFHFEVKVNAKGMPYLARADLMPTDNFVLELCGLLWKRSPSFREKVHVAVVMGDFES